MSSIAEKVDLPLAWRRTKADIQHGREFVQLPYETDLVDENLDEWLSRLGAKLSSGYRPGSVVVAEVPKGNGAVRPGALLSREDRVVYAAAVGALIPSIHAGLRWSQGSIDYGYQLANDPNRVDWFTNAYRSWSAFRANSIQRLDDGTAFVVVTDITGFYENIDLPTLFSDLRNLGCDIDVVQLLQTCLHRWGITPGRGIPQGSSPSDILAKVYLNPIDQAMVDAGIDFTRYVDDIRIFSTTTTSAKKSLMFLTQALRRRGLNLQSAKTSTLTADTARKTIEGIAPVIDALQKRYKKELEEIVGKTNPYAPITEIEIEVDPDSAPIGVLREVLERHFLRTPERFSVSLYHYLLNRLGAQKDTSAVTYCMQQLRRRPQETGAGLEYVKMVEAYGMAFPLIEEFLHSDDNIYDYQAYEIFRWLDSLPVSPSSGLVAIARQLAFDFSRPSYLRATCRKMLQNHGTLADIERLEGTYAMAHDDLERAQVLISLKRMEIGRRNAFYARVADDGLLCGRAVKLGQARSRVIRRSSSALRRPVLPKDLKRAIAVVPGEKVEPRPSVYKPCAGRRREMN